TTPRAPARETTAGTCQETRPSSRRCRSAASTNTSSSRATTSVAAIATACSSHHAPPPATRRTNAGNCSPIRPNTTLSSRNTTVWDTAPTCSRIRAVVSRSAWVPRITLATTTAVTPDPPTDSATTYPAYGVTSEI